MTQEKTLGELIKNRFPNFIIWGGDAPMNMDITHGIEIDYHDNRKYGYGETVTLYPFIKWSDGAYRPCHYWGGKYYIRLERR